VISSPPFVDIHNHLIPGVDDGARDLDESLAALEAMYEQGVRRLVATPHTEADLPRRAELYEMRMAQVDAAWDRFRGAANERFPEIELGRGFEIMLDVPQVQLADERLRLAGGAAVLVEFPRLFVPAGSTNALYNLRAEGWHPVVAHPERYVNLAAGDLSLIDEWRRAGALMAVNAGSLLGGFGPAALHIVREMLRRGWVDLVGSDYHARAGRRPLALRAACEQLMRWGGEEQAVLLFSVNAGLLMDGKEAVGVPPLPLRDSVWGRLRTMWGG
jgi:protein-tyrosine phosphatase